MATFEERFLNKLKELGGAEEAITNNAMRAKLGWKPERYDQTKKSLVDKKLITLAQGAGGKVRLTNGAAIAPKPLKVFISYAHVDEVIMLQLLAHLKPITKLGLVDHWYDGKIKPGEKWAAAIKEKLNEADIVLLLVSVDFINSEYCNEVELKDALSRNAQGLTEVIPIIARNCLWHDEAFGELQALPKNGQAITSWADRDDALTDVAKAVRARAKDLMGKKVN